MLGRQLPTLAGAAAQAGMSERTLQRRLTEEGTSLQEILDQCRRDLAEKLLLETDDSYPRSAINWDSRHRALSHDLPFAGLAIHPAPIADFTVQK